MKVKSKQFCYENNFNHGYNLIKKYVEVELYFVTYWNQLDFLDGFM